MTRDPAAPSIDASVPHPARRYNYWLGGKDNFAADRASGAMIAEAYPDIWRAALENRRFLHRAVRWLAREAGVRQFLDIGTGIPLSPNTHEIAQQIAPTSRVVYVDNDPLVLTHARALLTSHPKGTTAYIDADLNDPKTILTDSALDDTLDLTKPVAVLLVAVLHFVDDDSVQTAVRALVDTLAPGSFLVISHGTEDMLSFEARERLAALGADGGIDFTLRSRVQVEELFKGLELVEPGLVAVNHWRSDIGRAAASPDPVAAWGGVARVWV
jgi:hypothetical protein